MTYDIVTRSSPVWKIPFALDTTVDSVYPVIFHPDRQSQKDANTLQIAEKRFREILRAYESN